MNKSLLTYGAVFAAGVVVGVLGYRYCKEKNLGLDELVESIGKVAKSDSARKLLTGRTLGTVGAMGAAGMMLRRGRR